MSSHRKLGDLSTYKKEGLPVIAMSREDVQLDLLEFKEEGDEVQTKWRFNALLQLPWRPRLAAAGGTKHVLDQVEEKTLLQCVKAAKTEAKLDSSR